MAELRILGKEGHPSDMVIIVSEGCFFICSYTGGGAPRFIPFTHAVVYSTAVWDAG